MTHAQHKEPAAPTRSAPVTRRRSLPLSWPFALPALVALVLVLAYPLVWNFWVSLHVERLSPRDGEFVGLANYLRVYNSGALGDTILRTLVFTIGSVLAQFLLGLTIALALEELPRTARIVRPLLLMPWVMPGVAVAGVWLGILNPATGAAEHLARAMGFGPVGWLSTPGMAMTTLILVNTWKGSCYWMLMISAGLKTIPRETIEAARLDGASYLRVVWHVILPGLRPVLAAVAVLASVWTFNYFDLVFLLTNGGPMGSTATLPFVIWESSFKFYRYDIGATYSVVSVLFAAAGIGLYLFVTRKRATA